MKTKSIQIFFTIEDERMFSSKLREMYSDICFLDGGLWDYEPVIKQSLDECQSRISLIWNKNFSSQLKTLTRSNGKIEGRPAEGPCFQFQRSQTSDNATLLSGSLGVGYDEKNTEYKEYVNSVLKLVNGISVKGVHPVTEFNRIIDYSIKDNKYFTGLDALKQLNSSTINLLQHYKFFCLPVKGLDA